MGPSPLEVSRPVLKGAGTGEDHMLPIVEHLRLDGPLGLWIDRHDRSGGPTRVGKPLDACRAATDENAVRAPRRAERRSADLPHDDRSAAGDGDLLDEPRLIGAGRR